MFTRLFLSLCLATPLVISAGCSRMNCGTRCSKHGSPYAGMKYECACETCGPNCGPSCHEYACGCAEEATCACECGDKCGKSGSCWSGLCRHGCNGCGELYWSEWFNDPPSCCEPCDCHGNYTGPYETTYVHGAPHYSADGAGPAALPPLEVAPVEPPAADDGESEPPAPVQPLIGETE